MKLLVSVRNLAEVLAAHQVGVDIIDVKEPANGSLGRADTLVLRRIAQQFSGRTTLSAAMGELIDFQADWVAGDVREAISGLAGYAYIKTGLASCVSMENWQACLKGWAAEIGGFSNPVAVAYADYELCRAPAPAEIAQVAADAGCKFFLIDTFFKQGQNLFSHLDDEALAHLKHLAHSLGMSFALAGSLELVHVPRVAHLAPDILGVRGAVCRMSARNSCIDAQRIHELKSKIQNVQYELSTRQ